MTSSEAENIVRLIQDLKDSLLREIATLHDIYGTTKSRLDRHGAMLQTGSRWSTRMTTWSESIDRLMAKNVEDIKALEARVFKLEDRR
jgi:hypothetical protein